MRLRTLFSAIIIVILCTFFFSCSPRLESARVWRASGDEKANHFSPIFNFFLEHFSHLFASIFWDCVRWNLLSTRGCFTFRTNLHQLNSSMAFIFFIHFLPLFSSSTFSKSEKFLWHRDGHTTLPRNDNDKLRTLRKFVFSFTSRYTLSHRPLRGFSSFSREIAREKVSNLESQSFVRCRRFPSERIFTILDKFSSQVIDGKLRIDRMQNRTKYVQLNQFSIFITTAEGEIQFPSLIFKRKWQIELWSCSAFEGNRWQPLPLSIFVFSFQAFQWLEKEDSKFN